MRRTGLVALLMASQIAALPVGAAVENYPITFGPGGDDFVLTDGQAGPFSDTGLGVDSDNSATIGSAGVLLVNGEAFDPPSLDVTDASTRATASQRFGKLTATLALRGYETPPYTEALSFVYSIKNRSQRKKQTVELQWGGQRLNAANTIIYRTTNGDTTLDTNEPWMISQDNAAQPYSHVYALGTKGATSTIGNTPAGNTSRTFEIVIKPGKTKRFAFFLIVDPNDGNPELSAAQFNDKAALLDAGHLTSNIALANW